ncbi:MAG TPA: rRNA maturation RNase YbeY [Clostridiales bacterium]|nr:rRNA maturation RNase YbeY [Clostridiales bacterium]
MSIIITNESDTKYEFDYEKLIKDVINMSLEFVNCEYQTEINVILTSNDEIQIINKEYRGLDKATDVLSFPMIEFIMVGDLSNIEEEQLDCFNPETGNLILGDIVISNDKVYEQSKEYGHSVERELAFLVAHSMFHLFGYDHIDKKSSKIMERHQEKVLKKLKIVR